ncbi:Nitrogen permease regulator 2-like protein [Aphelenchoides besseyi]|nr:Nitrogen permease regulator 2-like protein [Aphelenchoides besseyi]KAI6217206.1 Nitrogen permease regulator 2-like protein [Aphelenchoides besseyi]
MTDEVNVPGCSRETENMSVYEANIPKLKAILFSEFDNEIGRVLKYQVPNEVVDKKQFDYLSATIIPSEEWRDRLIRLNIFDIKLIGYPVGIRSEKYHREMYIFNMCFIVDKADERDDSVYEPVVQKLSEYLVNLEREEDFLTNRKTELPNIMLTIFNDLNSTGECVLSVTPETTFYLKVCPSTLDNSLEIELINQFMVPVFVRQPPPTTVAELSKMDVLSQKVCPYINGISCIKDIAASVQIDVGLVGRCMRNLHHTGCITFLPIFLYSNQYVVKPGVRSLLCHDSVAQKCINFIRYDSTQSLPIKTDVFRLYTSLTPGITFGSWCKEKEPRKYNIDERRFIQFGVHFDFVQVARPYAFTQERTPLHSGTKRGTLEDELDGQEKAEAYEVAEDERSVDELSVQISVSPFKILKKLDRLCTPSIIYR